MKISEIQQTDVANYLRLEEGDYDSSLLQAVMDAAKKFILSYTGISDLDDYEDFSIAYLVLCQDMFDNRTLAVENTAVNRVVESILGLHVRNLV